MASVTSVCRSVGAATDIVANFFAPLADDPEIDNGGSFNAEEGARCPGKVSVREMVADGTGRRFHLLEGGHFDAV